MKKNMEFYYQLNETTNVNILNAVKRHSADECVSYKEVDGNPIYIGCYFPTDYDRCKNYPVIFMIHGGGWSSHKIFEDQEQWQGDYLGFLCRYYADKGFFCVSIDYRLSASDGQQEGYQIIDCYDDCADAVNYILDRTNIYGLDLKRVFVLGESAGGHLAGMLSTHFQRDDFQFQCSFLFNAITDLHNDEKWNVRIPLKSEHSKLTLMPPNEYARFLSPLYQIRDTNCPVILIHGEDDCVVNPMHSRQFYERMMELRRVCDVHWIADTSHAFLLAEYTCNISACKIGIKIINKYLCAILS